MHNNAPPRLLPRLLCRSTCSHFLPGCSSRQQVPITVVAPCANLECENAAHNRGDEEGYERSDASAAASCVVVSLPSVVAAAAIVAMISPKASFTGTQCFPLALSFFFFLGFSSSSLAVLLFLLLVTANMTHADSSSSASPPLSCTALVLRHGQCDMQTSFLGLSSCSLQCSFCFLSANMTHADCISHLVHMLLPFTKNPVNRNFSPGKEPCAIDFLSLVVYVTQAYDSDLT